MDEPKKIPEDTKMLLLTMELNRIAYERQIIKSKDEYKMNNNNNSNKYNQQFQEYEQQIRQLKETLNEKARKLDQLVQEIHQEKQKNQQLQQQFDSSLKQIQQTKESLHSSQIDQIDQIIKQQQQQQSSQKQQSQKPLNQYVMHKVQSQGNPNFKLNSNTKSQHSPLIIKEQYYQQNLRPQPQLKPQYSKYTTNQQKQIYQSQYPLQQQQQQQPIYSNQISYMYVIK